MTKFSWIRTERRQRIRAQDAALADKCRALIDELMSRRARLVAMVAEGAADDCQHCLSFMEETLNDIMKKTADILLQAHEATPGLTLWAAGLLVRLYSPRQNRRTDAYLSSFEGGRETGPAFAETTEAIDDAIRTMAAVEVRARKNASAPLISWSSVLFVALALVCGVVDWQYLNVTLYSGWLIFTVFICWFACPMACLLALAQIHSDLCPQPEGLAKHPPELRLV